MFITFQPVYMYHNAFLSTRPMILADCICTWNWKGRVIMHVKLMAEDIACHRRLKPGLTRKPSSRNINCSQRASASDYCSCYSIIHVLTCFLLQLIPWLRNVGSSGDYISEALHMITTRRKDRETSSDACLGVLDSIEAAYISARRTTRTASRIGQVSIYTWVLTFWHIEPRPWDKILLLVLKKRQRGLVEITVPLIQATYPGTEYSILS